MILRYSNSIGELSSADNPLIDRIVKLFNSHAPAALERIAAACGGNDAAAVAASVHALKSMCCNVGAVELGDLCDNYEDTAREQRRFDGKTIVETLTPALARARAELTAMAQRSAKRGAVVAPVRPAA